MTKPADIPQEVWDATDAIAEPLLGRHERGWVMWPLAIPAQEIASRAILAAKAEEREACIAAIERLHADAWGIPEEMSAHEHAIAAIRKRSEA